MADGYQGYGGYGAPQSVQDAQRRLAAAMMQNAVSTAPIQSPMQGVAQLGQALLARGMMNRLAPQRGRRA